MPKMTLQEARELGLLSPEELAAIGYGPNPFTPRAGASWTPNLGIRPGLTSSSFFRYPGLYQRPGISSLRFGLGGLRQGLTLSPESPALGLGGVAAPVGRPGARGVGYGVSGGIAGGIAGGVAGGRAGIGAEGSGNLPTMILPDGRRLVRMPDGRAFIVGGPQRMVSAEAPEGLAALQAMGFISQGVGAVKQLADLISQIPGGTPGGLPGGLPGGAPGGVAEEPDGPGAGLVRPASLQQGPATPADALLPPDLSPEDLAALGELGMNTDLRGPAAPSLLDLNAPPAGRALLSGEISPEDFDVIENLDRLPAGQGPGYVPQPGSWTGQPEMFPGGIGTPSDLSLSDAFYAPGGGNAASVLLDPETRRLYELGLTPEQIMGMMPAPNTDRRADTAPRGLGPESSDIFAPEPGPEGGVNFTLGNTLGLGQSLLGVGQGAVTGDPTTLIKGLLQSGVSLADIANIPGLKGYLGGAGAAAGLGQALAQGDLMGAAKAVPGLLSAAQTIAPETSAGLLDKLGLSNLNLGGAGGALGALLSLYNLGQSGGLTSGNFAQTEQALRGLPDMTIKALVNSGLLDKAAVGAGGAGGLGGYANAAGAVVGMLPGALAAGGILTDPEEQAQAEMAATLAQAGITAATVAPAIATAAAGGAVGAAGAGIVGAATLPIALIQAYKGMQDAATYKKEMAQFKKDMAGPLRELQGFIPKDAPKAFETIMNPRASSEEVKASYDRAKYLQTLYNEYDRHIKGGGAVSVGGKNIQGYTQGMEQKFAPFMQMNEAALMLGQDRLTQAGVAFDPFFRAGSDPRSPVFTAFGADSPFLSENFYGYEAGRDQAQREALAKNAAWLQEVRANQAREAMANGMAVLPGDVAGAPATGPITPEEIEIAMGAGGAQGNFLRSTRWNPAVQPQVDAAFQGNTLLGGLRTLAGQYGVDIRSPYLRLAMQYSAAPQPSAPQPADARGPMAFDPLKFLSSLEAGERAQIQSGQDTLTFVPYKPEQSSQFSAPESGYQQIGEGFYAKSSGQGAGAEIYLPQDRASDLGKALAGYQGSPVAGQLGALLATPVPSGQEAGATPGAGPAGDIVPEAVAAGTSATEPATGTVAPPPDATQPLPGAGFKKGGTVPKTGQYQLHKGEVVVPADRADDILDPAKDMEDEGRLNETLQGMRKDGTLKLGPSGRPLQMPKMGPGPFERGLDTTMPDEAKAPAEKGWYVHIKEGVPSQDLDGNDPMVRRLAFTPDEVEQALEDGEAPIMVGKGVLALPPSAIRGFLQNAQNMQNKDPMKHPAMVAMGHRIRQAQSMKPEGDTLPGGGGPPARPFGKPRFRGDRGQGTDRPLDSVSAPSEIGGGLTGADDTFRNMDVLPKSLPHMPSIPGAVPLPDTFQTRGLGGPGIARAMRLAQGPAEDFARQDRMLEGIDRGTIAPSTLGGASREQRQHLTPEDIMRRPARPAGAPQPQPGLLEQFRRRITG